MNMVELQMNASQEVVKDNYLIQKERHNLTTTQQKLLIYLISKIKPTDTELKEYEVSVSDFCELIGVDRNHFYSEFQNVIEDFDKCTFWVDTPTELYRFYWFSDSTYYKKQGKVKITLSKRLSKYLIGLTKNFTHYELYNILCLRSKYSIRLFELFKSYAYQHMKEFELDSLKELLYASNYKNFKDFRKRVLEPAIREINEFTELNVDYAEIKKGKKVIKLIFIIDKKDGLEAYKGYNKTMNKLLESNEQIKGQLTIYDMYNSEEQEK